MPRRPLPSAPRDHDATNQNATRFSMGLMLKEALARLERLEEQIRSGSA